MSVHPLEEILHPKSIAIAGASGSGRGGGFITPLQELGFRGDIYPVNPKYNEIMGMKAYARISDIPGPVDFVISSIPSTGILDLIDDCVKKGVKGVHLFTARFSETGRKDAVELEQELLRRAQAGGVRLIGPNCMGVYYPEEGIAFNDGMPKESGNVGLASQSGQVVGEIVGFAAQRGVRFSKAISYGNALDFNECDYLDYFAQDPQTDVILLYIEGVREGRRFVSSLRKAAAVKPVVILKGGRGEAGTRATASHTASMAGSQQLWHSMVRQAGAISVGDIEDLVDIAVGFYFMPLITGRRTAVAGGSGGSSVQAADQCEEAGLNVIPLPQDIRDELKAQGNPIWDWIGNPADFSISMGDHNASNSIMKMMAKHPDFDLIIMFVHGPWRRSSQPFSLDRHMEFYNLRELGGKPILAVFGDRPRGSGKEAEWYKEISAQIQERLIEAKFPVYPNVGRAARVANKIIGYYERKPK
ncbi:MAG: CoA-binding protein [Deltaproteobacteria bacterium]|nr:CoA-binding protein [Deltaproteobacteria bacterium]MBW2050615.1 CoA-binding protein [Deltaproteobacteria bacterium]MBW2139491.1 CoA-binding protein [Deltaproteobacteria bacterium]MBW2322560.1 CoA-binding protein [Deltaproteobacteria bacterium]